MKTLNTMISQKVVVRTFHAGVWFGTLTEKAKSEVILSEARRLWRWHAVEGISLSGVARAGIKHDDSRVEQAVDSVWLEAIEIIPCTDEAIASIESARHAAPR